jgi:ABC-2 type transport system ATP-binding protein
MKLSPNAARTIEERPRAPQDRARLSVVSSSTVVAEAVSKSFGDTAVVNDVSLEVLRGEVFGLIGPSGSGKSTLLRMMVGQAIPTSGSLKVLNCEPGRFTPSHRGAIGYVPQSFVLYPTLTVEQNARFVAGLYGMGWLERRRRIRETLQLLELWDSRRRRASQISGGMKRRLSLACALLHSPRILFVDEPTSGLDPILRSTIWDHLRTLASRGTTVFVTTQHLEESERCDRVALLHAGSVIALGSPEELRRQALGGHALDIRAPQFGWQDADALRALPTVQHISSSAVGVVRLVVDDIRTATPQVSACLNERGLQVDEIEANDPSFDEVFIALVERAKRDAR